ncbi:antibiotic biosynthesis monooxygenase [Paenibacillus apiarius]|uniref:Antibiotic biosynthesis monooxygenase n=1 Tax=Paenibacillus apiarius TaxID=46240 RepID=A0ABT4DS92_9BACL|nr:antibiotic biosynthesis monooxygenase [Paenibacillus apiarius]MCY9517076.1 antibiotic biosynthesis monooxygenase [Paenibacillus apiarius]MCY9520227.1 antibiotic biosynthesis monooxygenase [Paenibacillus apiarius]MCY9554885.1 antibiotic biosynthesis monooxygenase [Paenibacillus apiarius]MCY9561396.1 antibiotic biosynthesis monooxygenase [Paenibacillus apiarius]MCY9685918.1 antibiotic biosynthesis monooxygenase [Paenibacillus apiarius]
MIAVTNCIRVHKGMGSHLETRFERPKHVHRMPGFVSMELLKNEQEEDYDEFVVRTVWQDRAAFDSWVQSEEFTRGHSRREQADANIIDFKVTIYDVVHRHQPAAVSDSSADTAI